MTHTAKRADANSGTNRPQLHPSWNEKLQKALQLNGLKLLKLLVRMRSAVRICLAAQKPLKALCFQGFWFYLRRLIERILFHHFSRKGAYYFYEKKTEYRSEKQEYLLTILSLVIRVRLWLLHSSEICVNHIKQDFLRV